MRVLRSVRATAFCYSALLVFASGVLDAQCRGGFRRGDANVDSRVDIADGVYVLNYLFLGGRASPCEDAADSNDTGGLDLSDAVFVFNFLFGGGPTPAEPGPAQCGPDPTDDALVCESYESCVLDLICTSSDCCKDGFFCAKADGDCDGAGVCQERPVGCDQDFNPVCGCDGQTYANRCEANAAGVNVSHEGECGGPPRCSTNFDCPLDSYCAKKAGDCDGIGSCEVRGLICPLIFAPVCGCDGQTYSNACVAASSGVNVLHDGECGVICKDNSACPEGSYCARSPGDCDGIGDCQPRPGGCPENFDPVCGCDGVTYGNDCEAASAGVTVLHRGECRPGGCVSNDDCDGFSVCVKDDGDCDGVGVCERRPDACIAIFDPVCGCDGENYSNRCVAHAAGVSVRHEGECRENACNRNGDCPGGSFCQKPDGDCDGIGVCERTPLGCPDNVDPVCGCDGQTYSNRCDAQAAGISVVHEGECRVPPCRENPDCGGAQFCSKIEGDCDGTGICEDMPFGCPRDFNPVCGCDGLTYPNACNAAAAGVSVLHHGECAVGDCSSNGDCDDDAYCAKSEGDCDGPGRCKTRPVGCEKVLDPVCGCDGQTYGNECEAAAAGVAMLHTGPCEE
jgi:hypothetical protein